MTSPVREKKGKKGERKAERKHREKEKKEEEGGVGFCLTSG